ncbi:OLC1v1025122C1 [Oldenlandia corymbosa var. corymbosa]|uniref:Receptor-like serine/threonine-protein kinase n=1 Tax=Oldenlandia corymbosa var. corymbosa TaxID=529605 RepID=A0AAV1C406_OLDCO|nr:OLC1v1025122C1 [Oldenlandia corymbosa var. corymbosa]
MENQKTSINFILGLFCLCICLKSQLALGADSISGNQSLSGDQTLISKDGNFELGFFSPGKNSSRFYIGIWYKKVSEPTVVWVANRVAPVKDKYSSSLTIQGSNLVILDESQKSIWSTNVSATNSGPVVAVLRDDGNLVLTDGSSILSNSSSIPPIWQSFDNPTDTWLPGGKLAYNKVTKKLQILTSWKNSEDPAPGLFSLELDAIDNQYVIKWNRSQQYWVSGAWDEQSKLFSLVPEMRLNYIYNFSYVNNENESYFTYSVYSSAVISRFVMDVSGQIKQFTWLDTTKQWNMFWSQPRQQCEVYAFCGEFGICNENSLPFCNCLGGFDHKSEADWNLNDFSGGCVRKTDLQCVENSSGKGQKNKFRVYPGMSLPRNPQPVKVGNAAECESSCLSNCSCTAYTYDSNGCSIWNERLLDLQQLSAGDNRGKSIYIRLAASEFSSGKKNTAAIVGAGVGSVALVLVILAVILFVMLRRRRRMVGAGKAADGSLVAFSYKDLQNATKNFSEKLGVGGFGSVFKGKLPDSSAIAVKKLESVSQGEKQFRTEVSTIGTIQHVNLVRLRGFCSEGNKKLLVYEYLENRSLDSHLFHDDESRVLSWKIRYQIALGTARGLAYLHEKCREVIIHCDIKPENILLDAEFCPKVADFGLAKLMGRDFSRVLTTMRGTRGYLAPEWISGVAITAKADVYSYGMMLFEFISGKRNSESSPDGVLRFFPCWVARVIVEEGDVLSLLDPKLERMADAAEALRLCKVACWCIQDDENHRPSMGQVVQILEGVLDVNLPPVPRALQNFFDNQEDVVFFTESSSNQSSEPQSKVSSTSAYSKSTSESSKVSES